MEHPKFGLLTDDWRYGNNSTIRPGDILLYFEMKKHEAKFFCRIPLLAPQNELIRIVQTREI